MPARKLLPIPTQYLYWSGAGYIITDLVRGDGAFKISGGGNGGFILGFLIGSALISILALISITVIAGGIAGVGLIALITFILFPVIAVAVTNIINFIEAASLEVQNCFWTGFSVGFTLFAYLSGTAGGGDILGFILTILGIGLLIDAEKTGTSGIKQCLFA